MATPVTVSHTGALRASPAASPSTLMEVLLTSFEATYQGSKSSHPTVNGATDLAPFVVGLDGVVKVRVFAIRVNSGSLKVKVTSAVGTDQAINVGSNGLLLWHSPYISDELTAIKLVGTADCDIVLAGDL